MNNKKISIIIIGISAALLATGIFLYNQNEVPQESPEFSGYVGELWIINYEANPDSFPVDSLNKELRMIFDLRDTNLDPISGFDTLDKILERKSYVSYDGNVSENMFGLLIRGDNSLERPIVQELLEEIGGVTDVKYHNNWNYSIEIDDVGGFDNP